MVSFGLFAITAKNKTTDAHTIGKQNKVVRWEVYTW